MSDFKVHEVRVCASVYILAENEADAKARVDRWLSLHEMPTLVDWRMQAYCTPNQSDSVKREAINYGEVP